MLYLKICWHWGWDNIQTLLEILFYLQKCVRIVLRQN